MIQALYLLLIAPYLFFLSSCGDLPRPFHRSTSPPSTLTQPKGDNGVRVSFPLGTTKPMSTQIATAVVKALLEHNIPASLGKTGKLRYLLSSRIESNSGVTDSLPSRINWKLSGDAGAWYYNFYQDFNSSIWEGGVGSQKVIDDLGKTVANIIANTLIPEDKTLTPVASKAPSIWLLPIKGDSKLRVNALSRSIRHALSGAKLNLSKTRSAAQYFLKGKIAFGPVENKSRLTEVSWTVTDSNKNSMGKLVQRNTIPTDDLHKFWKETSLLIATAAVPGIKNLLHRTTDALNRNFASPNRPLKTDIPYDANQQLLPRPKLSPESNLVKSPLPRN